VNRTPCAEAVRGRVTEGGGCVRAAAFDALHRRISSGAELADLTVI
jgi:hypothetical protein